MSLILDADLDRTMFSGMLANIPNPYMQPAQAIPLDFPWMSISIFLDAALSRTRLDYKACSFTDLHRYRKLVHHLDCDRLVPHADIAFRYACKAKPIEWLYCASEEDDLPTAISALQMCRAENVGITSKMVFDMTWRVRLEWRQPLLKCLLHGGDSDSDIEVDELRTRWPKTSRAKQFESDVIKARAEMSG